MKTEYANEVFSLIEAEVRSRLSPVDFEMAYQVRIAIDRIRFAIKATDQHGDHLRQLQEAGLQLLDALDRLESADRQFQRHFRAKSEHGITEVRPSSSGLKAYMNPGALP